MKSDKINLYFQNRDNLCRVRMDICIYNHRMENRADEINIKGKKSHKNKSIARECVFLVSRGIYYD